MAVRRLDRGRSARPLPRPQSQFTRFLRARARFFVGVTFVNFRRRSACLCRAPTGARAAHAEARHARHRRARRSSTSGCAGFRPGRSTTPTTSATIADGLKVGGHQASCASMTAIMAALYFHALGPNDRVAVKPHAGPVLHAIHYLLGSQSREQLREFPRLRRHAKLSQPDQGQDPGRFLDRLGRPRRRDHRLLQPDPGLSHRPRHDGRGRPRPLRRADRRCRARRGQYLRSADRGLQARRPQSAGGSSTTTARASTRPAPTACSSGSTRFSAAAAGASVELRYGKQLRGRARRPIRRSKAGSTRCPTPIFRRFIYQGGAAWRARHREGPRQDGGGLPQGP